MRKLGYLTIILPLLVICYVSQVSAQRFAPGYCPTVTAHENFDKTKFFGNWIEVEKTPSIFDLMMRCLVVDFSDDQDNTVNVVVRGVSLAGLPLTVNGDGLLQDVHRSGFYSIRYGFGVPFQGTLTTIIDTDYDDYAVVYSCTNSLLSGVFHTEYIWVLSRSGKISNPTRQNIYEKLDKLQINRSGLTMSDRGTCPTNSSTVARESDKDLATQLAGGATSGAAAGSSVASGSPGAADGSAGGSSSSSSAINGSGDKLAVQEQAQKQSVVVPLLYDLPSPVSSSSVGGARAGASKLAPPAPVENKVPQLPLSSSVVMSSSGSQGKQVSAPVKPISGQQQAPIVPATQVSGGQQQVAAAPAVSAAALAAGLVSSKPTSGVNQQPQQQSLLAKIQQKP